MTNKLTSHQKLTSSPLAILLPFVAAVASVVALRVCGHPEGVGDILSLVATVYAVMGWRSALPVPEGGGAMVLDRRGLESIASGRFPADVAAELGGPARLAHLVVQALEVRGLEVPQAVARRLGDADEPALWRALGLAQSVQRAEDVLREPQASQETKPYPAELQRGAAPPPVPVEVAEGADAQSDTAKHRKGKRPFPLGLLFLGPLALLALVNCADPLQHQRGVSRLHSQAATACKAAPARCGALDPCAKELRTALGTWQKVNEARARGEDGAPETADALVQEGTARTSCLAAGVR